MSAFGFGPHQDNLVGRDDELLEAFDSARNDRAFAPYTSEGSAGWEADIERKLEPRLKLDAEEARLRADMPEIGSKLKTSGFHALKAALKVLVLSEVKNLQHQDYELIRRELLATHPEAAQAFELSRLGPSSDEIAKHGLAARAAANAARRLGKPAPPPPRPAIDPTRAAETIIERLLKPLDGLAQTYYRSRDRLDVLPAEKRRAEERLLQPHGSRATTQIYLKRP